MGTLENLSSLAEQLRVIRERLEANADRAAAMLERLRKDAPTIVKLDQLAQTAHQYPRSTAPSSPILGERFEGDLVSADAWEISLINEEG